MISRDATRDLLSDALYDAWSNFAAPKLERAGELVDRIYGVRPPEPIRHRIGDLEVTDDDDR